MITVYQKGSHGREGEAAGLDGRRNKNLTSLRLNLRALPLT